LTRSRLLPGSIGLLLNSLLAGPRVVRFARQKCQAFRVRITDTTGADVTEGLNLTSLVFEIGLKKGVAKLLAAEKF
jgi:hypothetical protein